jgi:hypothetical protein
MWDRDIPLSLPRCFDGSEQAWAQHRQTKEQLAFEDWLRNANALLLRRYGVDYRELPDDNYRAHFDAGEDPHAMVGAVSVQEIVAECGEDAATRILDALERQSWADDGIPAEGVLVRYCTEQPALIHEQGKALAMRRASPPRGLVFVGERRSPKAQALGVSLQDGRLAARTLHDALRAADVDPAAAVYVNLFHDDPADRRPCENTLQAIRSLAAAGAVIVALGRAVQAGLHAAGVPFVPLTHPAARGAIRAKPVYQQHVRDALAGALRA